jgi:O-antigen ligase
MNASCGSLRTRLFSAAEGRVVVGIVVVLVSVLILPVAVWLVVLCVAMASRPSDSTSRASIEHSALRHWLIVSGIFVGGVFFTMLGKPITGHGVQLLVWFALLPAIGALFWLQRRRADTIAALWLGATVGACTAGLVAVIQVGVLGDPRATGVVANSITFGNVALLMGGLSMSLHGLVDRSGRTVRTAAFAAVALGLTASVLSGSRGGWLVVPLLIAALLWQARTRLPRRRVGQIAIGLMGLLVFANVVSGGMPTSRATASVTNVSGYSSATPTSGAAASSEGARIEAWRAAGEAFHDHPIAGIGWGNLGDRFVRDADLGLRNDRIATFEHAHNQLLGAAANGGLIGVTTLIALFAVPLVHFVAAARSSDQRRRTLGLTGILTLGSYAVFGVTEAVLENLVPVVLLAAIVAALCAELDAPVPDVPVDAPPRSIRHIEHTSSQPPSAVALYRRNPPFFGTSL